MRDRGSVAEIICFTFLLAYLVWVPLPFGSASDGALTPLVVPPLLLASAAVMIMSRRPGLQLTRPGRLWTAGALLFTVFIALQLVPLPGPLLRAISPESARLWSAADRVAALAGAGPASIHALHPISVDPAATAVQLFRIAAYAGTFIAAMFVARTKNRRLTMVFVLALMVIFEAVYAIREAVMQRYEIWGWKNTLIYDRATGTFVNPNHFAHYAAIILPFGVFLCAYAWHTAAPGAPVRRRLVVLFERRFVLLGLGAAAIVAAAAAILVAQSRGAMLATVTGFAAVGAIASGRRRAAARAGLIALAVIALFAGVYFVMGRATDSRHLGERDSTSLQGRRSSVLSAFRIWTDFPLFGSGAGTFQNLSPRAQDENGEVIQNHAHNDYAETLATTGAIGFLLAFVPLLGGTAALVRYAFGARRSESSWRRRAFYTAALTSIAIALAHAMVDFNFYIPANPVTLAAIAGAAASVRESAAT
jgi:putative inorganic carbon (hco3(-)) transporter